MPIQINIDKQEKSPLKIDIGPGPKGETLKFKLDARKTLDGNIIIFDHGDVDIVIMPEKSKIVAFPKNAMNDIVYGAQDRLFKYLKDRGLITMGSVRGGNAYGSIEAEIPVTNHPSPIKLIMLNISKWVGEERPYFEALDFLDDMEEEHLTSPQEEDSTALGDVPHDDKKGSMITGLSLMHSPYYYNYYLQEDKER
tara:strand:+ start:1285 stop:1872 length:588 start_codon:yes stop_codon:yes gene_type:complete